MTWKHFSDTSNVNFRGKKACSRSPLNILIQCQATAVHWTMPQKKKTISLYQTDWISQKKHKWSTLLLWKCMSTETMKPLRDYSIKLLSRSTLVNQGQLLGFRLNRLLTQLNTDKIDFLWGKLKMSSCHGGGLGFKISFPLSSQDILYSARNVRHLEAMIEAATTLLWMPKRKSRANTAQLMVKKGWFQSDCDRLTLDVSGSHNHVHAPTIVHIEIKKKIIRQNLAAGWCPLITSVNLRSKAFRSSVCSAILSV